MRWKKGFIVILTMCLLLMGCAGEIKAVQEAEEDSDSKIQIGISFDSFVIERWIRDRDVFVSTANKLGAQVNVQNANGDVKEQISQIEYFIEKKMDVIVVVAVDCDTLGTVIKKAKTEGINVINYDRLVKNSNADLYISFDNEVVGRLMAEGLINAIPQGGDIFMIKGPVEDNNVALVSKGFHEKIKDSNLKVVYGANCDGWLAEEAFGYVNEGLKEYPNVAGIMCGNDDLASYAFRALAENRKAGEVALVGQDGDLTACQRIVEGTQTMTVYKSVDKLAAKAAECAVKLAKGQDLNVLETIDDGSNNVPFLKLTPVAVNKDNMDEVIIDGGFHLREDVYLNADACGIEEGNFLDE